MSLCQPVIWSMAAIKLRDSTVVAAVVRTRPRAIPLAMITMRKSTHGFPFVSHIWVAYGAPLGGPSGRRSSATKFTQLKDDLSQNNGLLFIGFLMYNFPLSLAALIFRRSAKIHVLSDFFFLNSFYLCFSPRTLVWESTKSFWRETLLTCYCCSWDALEVAVSKLTFYKRLM